jgi:hypothetical protein
LEGTVSRYIIIDGKRYSWRDILALRREQRQPALPQPTLFEVKDDRRPAAARTANGRYAEPSLFDGDPR